MALPFLPGNYFNKQLGKTKFHKSHHLDFCNNVSHLYGDDKCGIGGEVLSGQRTHAPHSTIPPGCATFDLPAWAAFDKQVLSFDGYFQETVSELRVEQYRVHRVKVYFYLEDDSIQVVEPRLKNSCMSQGTLTRRHRIPKPHPEEHLFYRVDDLNIGVDLSICGRVIKLTNCDGFTSQFIHKLGVRLNKPIQIPADPYMDNRKAIEEAMQPARPYEPTDGLKQFLDHDRHVLRFYCYWDDRDNMFGEIRYMVLHYFLADDTVEVHEIRTNNSGRDDTATLIRRQLIPKAVEQMPQPGQATKNPLLNTFGNTLHGYFSSDPIGVALKRDYYKDADLRIGAVLNIYNRKFVIYDCDEFTKEYYKVKFGITDFTPMDPVREVKEERQERQMPPHNGYGAEEDSIGNCRTVIPKAPQRDFVKFMAHDRRGLDGQVIRFTVKLVTDVAVDKDRRFILSFYRTDDTLDIFEPPVRNSGFWSGKFLERGRVRKPNQPRYLVEFSKYYTLSDVYIGAVLDINSYKFEVVDADEYAYNYLEKHSNEFPQSDINSILSKLHAALEPQRATLNYELLCSQHSMAFDDFCRLIKELAPCANFTDHDLITLGRHYQDRNESGLPLNVLLAIVHDQLKRASWEGFDHIEEQCLHHDNVRSGLLEKHIIRAAMKAARIPIQNDVLNSLLTALARPEDGLIEYPRLARLVNWRCYPVAPLKMESAECADHQAVGTVINNVNLAAIMRDINVVDRPQVRDPCDPAPEEEPAPDQPSHDERQHNGYTERCHR